MFTEILTVGIYASNTEDDEYAAMKERLNLKEIQYVFTSHNGFTDDAASAFKHINVIPNLMEKGFQFDPDAPYDGYEEEDDTEVAARTLPLSKKKQYGGAAI